MTKFNGNRVCKKCGREWFADWRYGRNGGYARVCTGCNQDTKRCTCAPLLEAAR